MNANTPALGNVVGIVLAAGRGERFDPLGRSDKLLARVDGSDSQGGGLVVNRALAALATCCDRLIAVVRDDAAGERVRAAITVPGVEVVPCADAGEGMGRSLACGVRAACGPAHDGRAMRAGGAAPRAVLVLPGDMPFLRPETAARVLAAMCDTHAADSHSADAHAADKHTTGAPTAEAQWVDARAIDPQTIAAPVYRGRRGHPVAFGAAHLAALMQSRGDEGARRLLRTQPVTLVETDDAGTVRDVDTPQDLRAAPELPVPSSRPGRP